MEIISTQLSINLSKSQLSNILVEVMHDEVANTAIKRILNPYLAGSFTQFPEHTNIALGSTDSETGITTVSLKIPAKRKETTPEEMVNEPTEEVENTPQNLIKEVA